MRGGFIIRRYTKPDVLEQSVIQSVDKERSLFKEAEHDKKLQDEIVFNLDHVSVKRALTILRHAMVHIQTNKWKYGDK